MMMMMASNHHRQRDAQLLLLSYAGTTSTSHDDIQDASTGHGQGLFSDAAISGISGAGSGIVALLVTYPLLTATTRQQTAAPATTAATSSSQATTDEASTPENKSTMAWSTSGLASLYDGLGPALLGTTASQGVYYYFYAYFIRKIQGINNGGAASSSSNRRIKKDGQLSAGAFLAAAALAGAVNVLLTNPIWLVVTRLQVMRKMKNSKNNNNEKVKDLNASVASEGPPRTGDHEQHQQQHQHEGSVAAAVKEVLAESGVAGLWRGVVPSLVMVVNPAISYMLFEMLKKSSRRATATVVQGRQGRVEDVNVWSSFVNGALAKLGATVVTYPLQLVKSRLQAGVDENDGDSGSKSAGTKKNKGGVMHTVQKILRDEGMQGFYRGISTKICQSVFAAALLFAVQDALKASIVAVLKPGSSQRRLVSTAEA